jgi:hypothetical protein
VPPETRGRFKPLNACKSAKSRVQTASIRSKSLNCLSFPQTRKPARFGRTGWWSVVGSNRGPHHDALWNSHFNIRLWETEFCAQRLPGEFDGRALPAARRRRRRTAGALFRATQAPAYGAPRAPLMSRRSRRESPGCPSQPQSAGRSQRRRADRAPRRGRFGLEV